MAGLQRGKYPFFAYINLREEFINNQFLVGRIVIFVSKPAKIGGKAKPCQKMNGIQASCG